MKLSASLSLTPKGVEEVLNRTYKLNFRQRSVLILLGKPQTIDHIIQKLQIFSQDEVIEVIRDIENGGFIAVNGGAIPRATAPASGGNIQLLDGIIITEAKFLLVDFCVDSFGTQSQEFIDEIGSCENKNNLQLCLKKIYATTEMHAHDRMPILLKIIAEINATA